MFFGRHSWIIIGKLSPSSKSTLVEDELLNRHPPTQKGIDSDSRGKHIKCTMFSYMRSQQKRFWTVPHPKTFKVRPRNTQSIPGYGPNQKFVIEKSLEKESCKTIWENPKSVCGCCTYPKKPTSTSKTARFRLQKFCHCSHE